LSARTDALLAEVSAHWQETGSGDRCIPLFPDCFRSQNRDAESRQVQNKAFYVALGRTPEGEREGSGAHGVAINEGGKILALGDEQFAATGAVEDIP